MITEKEFRSNTEQRRNSLEFPEMPFVGRVGELQELDQRLEKVRDGEGGLVFLRGEAGIGKTRLANEVIKLANQKEYRCLFAKCRSDVGSPLYFPWMELVRKFSEQASAQLFFKVCGALTEQIVRLVPELFESSHPGTPRSDPVFDAQNQSNSASPSRGTAEEIQKEEIQFLHSLTHLFVRLSQEAPLLLVFDDLQWCDAASLRLINFFVTNNHLAKSRILFFCLYRDIDLQGGPGPALTEFALELEQKKEICGSIRLERFTQANVTELVNVIFHSNANRSFQDDFSRSLYFRTGGNPLFIGEMLKSLIETREISRNEEGGWICSNSIERFQLPDTVRSVIEQRLGRLDDLTLEALEIASTIGEQFNLESLNDVVILLRKEDPTLVGKLERASKSGLVLATKSSSSASSKVIYTFSDEWVRDLLYEKLSPAERQRYHLAIAKSLESRCIDQREVSSGEHYYELAQHYLKGGELGKAQSYFVMSAKRAAGLFAHQESYSRYNTALDLLEHIDSSSDPMKYDLLRAEILKSMGDEAQFLPQYVRTFDCWKKAAELYEKHSAWLKAADIYSKLGMAYHIVMYELEESEAALNKAVELAKRDTKTPSIELARLTAYAMTADIWRSDVEKVREKSRIATKLAEESGAFDVLAMVCSYGIAADLASEIDKSIESCNRGLKISAEHDLLFEASYNYFHRAVSYTYTYGPSQKALDLFLEGLNYTQSKGNFMVNLFHKVELVYGVFLPLGEWAKAKEMAEDSLDSIVGFPPGSLFCLIAQSAMGQVLLHCGDLQRAEEFLEHVRTSTKGFGVLQLDVPLYIALARLQMQRGDLDKAKQVIDEGYRLARQRGLTVINGIPYIQQVCLMIEYCLERSESGGKKLTDEDQEYLDERASELSKASKEIGKSWTKAYILRAEGLVAQGRKQRDRSIELLEKGLAEFQKLGWPYEVARTQFMLGKAHFRMGNILSSGNYLDAALAGFSKLGARIDIERTELLKKRIQDREVLIPEEHPKFNYKDSKAIFEALKIEFMHDYVFRRLEVESCGWRSPSELLRELTISKHSFYGRSEGRRGPALNELVSMGVVETRVFSGQRGRGGEITKFRLGVGTRLKKYASKATEE